MREPKVNFILILFVVLLIGSCKEQLYQVRGQYLIAKENISLHRNELPILGKNVKTILGNDIAFLNNSHEVYSFSISCDLINQGRSTWTAVKYPILDEVFEGTWGYDANCYFRFMSDGKVLWKFFPSEKMYLTEEKFYNYGFEDKFRKYYTIFENGKKNVLIYPKPLNGFNLENQDHTLHPSYSGVYGKNSKGNIVLEFIVHRAFGKSPQLLTFIGIVQNDKIIIKNFMISNKTKGKLDKSNPIEITATRVDLSNLPEVKPIYEPIDELKQIYKGRSLVD